MIDIKSYDSFIKNETFNIKTSKGFKHFDGITRTKVNYPLIKLTVNNDVHIIATPNHKLYISENETEYVKFLKVGDSLYSSKYNETIITKIEDYEYECYVYDILNVEDEHSYEITKYAIKSSNCLYLDEFAFVENDVEFYTSTYPTVTSGKTTKVIITSTPNGLNMFYKIFNDSQNGNNSYVSYKINWYENPTRDTIWEEETRKNIGEAKFSVEYLSVAYETNIKVKDNNNNSYDIQIGELYENLFKTDKNYQVLTNNGYEDFEGINKIQVNEYIEIKFHNHKLIRCSTEHPFIDINGNLIKAKDLDKEIIHCEGSITFLENKKLIKEKIELYDIVNSGSNHVYYTNGVLSHNCSFLGSAGTLIAGPTLEKLSYNDPIKENITDSSSIKVYAEPQNDHIYVSIVDTAEGTENDYSVINIIDITQAPYKQVFIYRDNLIQPLLFGDVIYEVAKKYNNSFVIIENNNSSGALVANYLWYDLEYENMLTSKVAYREDSDIDIGAAGSKTIIGIRTTKKTKAVGCTYLKNLIETNKLIIQDFDTIGELSTFIKVGKSYEAEKGKHDDIVMTLVLFAWFSTQDFFEDVTNISTGNLINSALKENDDYLSVLGFISNGIDDDRHEFDNGITTVNYDPYNFSIY